MTSKDIEDTLGDQLLHAVKVEVKRLMEEAVTKKFIHEGSSTVTSFCAAVEACLQHGLKKRSIIFGGANAQGTFALLERVSRTFEPAMRIVKMTRDTESAIAAAAALERQSNGHSSAEGSMRSGESATLPRIFSWQLAPLSRTVSDATESVANGRAALSRQSSIPPPPHTPPAASLLRYLWIRIALTEHVLHLIVHHIACNASKYYERQAVMADQCVSALLVSLIDGPCTLDFTKVKTCDHFLTDPPAEELIQRHRIHTNSLFHSGSLAAQSRFGTPVGTASQRPSLHVRKKPRRASGSDGMTSDWQTPFGAGVNLSGAAVSGAAKDYIEALHQNNRTTLLYGKNNVRVQLKLLEKPLCGYLQLHQTTEPDCALLLKWTPNQLMNAGVDAASPADSASDSASNERNFAQRSQSCLSSVSASRLEPPNTAGGVQTHDQVKDRASTEPPQLIVTDTGDDEESLSAELERDAEYRRLHRSASVRLPISDRIQRHRVHLSPSHYRHQFRLTHEEPLSLLKAIANYGRRRLFWKYALTVPFDDVVYIHCHCHRPPEEHDTVILVGRDGAQYPPFDFPKGGHLLQFLTCIENGVQLAGGFIDPPLSTERLQLGVDCGPRLRRRSSLLQLQRDASANAYVSIDAAASSEVLDFVFRIIHPHVVYQYSDDDDINTAVLALTSARTMNEEDDSVRASTASLAATAGAAPASTDSPSLSLSASASSTALGASASTSGLATASASNSAANTTETLAPHEAIRQLCETMRTQLLSRAFYGWLDYTRHIKTVRTHLAELVNATIVPSDSPIDARRGLTSEAWQRMRPAAECVLQVPLEELHRLVYFGGCAADVRRHVWPYLLGHYGPESTAADRDLTDRQARVNYERTVGEWLAVEAIVQQREKERLEAFLSKKSGVNVNVEETGSLDTDVFDRRQAAGGSSYTSPLHRRSSLSSSPTGSMSSFNNDDVADATPKLDVAPQSAGDDAKPDDMLQVDTRQEEADPPANVIVQVSGADAEVPVDSKKANSDAVGETTREKDLLSVHGEIERTTESPGIISNSKESLVSPGSPASNGDVYRRSLIEEFGLNLHRIDKDVQRCDRNHPYFTNPQNLEKLRNIVCTYVWTHLDMGYAQGMCDLVAPLLVIFDDEALTYSCYLRLMDRVVHHFPRDGVPHAVLDARFASMRSLVQILDAELFELMQRNGDYTHFFFAYRWFLLEFKRELAYNDVFSVWECIWSAPAISTSHFVLFIALALVQFYREIIIDNNMDFTDIIRFFNEMAEKHDARQLLCVARYLVYQLQTLIQNR